MRRKITFLKTCFLAIILFVGIGEAWGQKTYNLVTSNAELVAGGKYLIVGYKDTNTLSLSKQETNNRASAPVTISSGTISTTPATAAADAKPFEITLGGTSGAWTLFDAVNNGYLYAANTSSGKNNYLKNQATTTNWTITVAATGVATMTDIGSSANGRNILRMNPNNPNDPLFSCYASGQNDVYLYKEASAPCTPSNLAFTNSTTSKTMGDAPFTITPTSLNETTAIAYSSTNPSVATVNSATGVVTIIGAGTTKIKADQAAGTHSGTDYCAGSAEYELTVSPLAVPVATAATDITSSGFTANWEAVTGATSYKLDVYTKEGGEPVSKDVTKVFADYNFANASTFPSGTIQTGLLTFTTDNSSL